MRRFATPFFAAALVGVGSIGLITPAARAASPKLTLGDRIGEAVDSRPSMDIERVSFEVKKVKASDPKPSVIITVKLSAAPEKQLVSYDVYATIPECGSFQASYAPGSALNPALPQSPASVYVCNGGTSETDSLDLFHPKFAVGKDNTLTWTIALDSFPKLARAGGALTDIKVETQTADPVFGLEGNGSVLGLPTDDMTPEVTANKEFRFV